MKLSEVIECIPSSAELDTFKRFLTVNIEKGGDRELSDDTLQEIELQIRAHIDTKFDLRKA